MEERFEMDSCPEEDECVLAQGFKDLNFGKDAAVHSIPSEKVDSVNDNSTDSLRSGNLPSDTCERRFDCGSSSELLLGRLSVTHTDSLSKTESDERIPSDDLGVCLSNPTTKSLRDELEREKSFASCHSNTDNGRSDSHVDSVQPPTEETDEPDLSEEIAMQDEDGDTQIHSSITQLLETVTLELISQLTSPLYLDIQNDYLQTPLHLAVITRQPVIVRRLLAAGASVDIPDLNGNTPLHIAASDGHVLITRILLEPVHHEEVLQNRYETTYQKIPQNLEIRNYAGQTCLHLAAEESQTEVLQILLSKGADVNARDGKSGRSILHYAAETRNLVLLQFLLQQRWTLNLNAMTYAGITPIKLALGRSHLDVVDILRCAGADYQSDDSSGEEDMDDQDQYNNICIAGMPVPSLPGCGCHGNETG